MSGNQRNISKFTFCFTCNPLCHMLWSCILHTVLIKQAAQLMQFHAAEEIKGMLSEDLDKIMELNNRFLVTTMTKAIGAVVEKIYHMKAVFTAAESDNHEDLYQTGHELNKNIVHAKYIIHMYKKQGKKIDKCNWYIDMMHWFLNDMKSDLSPLLNESRSFDNKTWKKTIDKLQWDNLWFLEALLNCMKSLTESLEEMRRSLSQVTTNDQFSLNTNSYYDWLSGLEAQRLFIKNKYLQYMQGVLNKSELAGHLSNTVLNQWQTQWNWIYDSINFNIFTVSFLHTYFCNIIFCFKVWIVNFFFVFVCISVKVFNMHLKFHHV